MSSRVRIMLQDFGNSTSWLGKSAFNILQELYKDWERGQNKPAKKTKKCFKQVSEEHAGEHPFMVSHWIVPPDIKIPIAWTGPGYYQEHVEIVDVPKKPVPGLPSGPRWLVALEMWSRMEREHGGRYKLFLSRDNRKHAWRRSLCNPFFQSFGYKIKPPKPKAAKVQGRASGRLGDWPIPRADGASTTALKEPAPPPVKPRVGIWS